jgi:N-methylhydantoinase A
MAELNVGVDVGGTFTDFVATDQGSTLRLRKVLTTYPDPAVGILAGLQELLGPKDSVKGLVHGTTIVTNAIHEGKVARTALVTTRGFRDVLEIARGVRDHLYRLDIPGRQPPIVPRHLRFEITERVDHRGNILVPIEKGEVARIRNLIDSAGVEAVAVCLLHSYARPDHERMIAEALTGAVGYVALSSEVSPESREFERTHTTCANASVLPLVDQYLGSLERALSGVRLRLMQSSGGMITPGLARRVPLTMFLSGPAGGVAAAAAAARRFGLSEVVTLDMGGTSTDVCLIRDGRIETVTERRFGGHPVRLRSLAVETIGAGGGSIVWVDPVGRLRVGPQSAGSKPGPVCYNRGGTEPTVTDADLILGYLDPEAVLGGVIRLGIDAAREALKRLGRHFGLGAEGIAAGVVEIVTEAMRGAVRLVSVRKGHDVRNATLIAYGGAGPVHAALLARALGIKKIMVPALSSFFSAYGCLVADLRFDRARTFRRRLTPDVWAELEEQFVRVEDELVKELERELGSAEGTVIYRSLDLRYVGQNYELEVPLAQGHDPTETRAVFDRLHEHIFGYATDDPVEVISVRVSAVVPTEPPPLPAFEEPGTDRPVARRSAFFASSGWSEVPVYLRNRFLVNRWLEGPAILQDEWSTVLVLPGQLFSRDEEGNIWIREAV